MKRALITGAAGFIGRHFTRRLLDDGWNVDAFDVAPFLNWPFDGARRSSSAWQQEACDFFRRDVRRFDLVIHCAANVGGRTKIDGSPIKVARNLAIDQALFDWALETRPGRIVYFSSSAVYPTMLQTRERSQRLYEDLVLPDSQFLVGVPDQTYGWAKLTGERLACLAEAEGLRVHTFRPFSGYGEDQSLDYPFPSFADRARRRMAPFEIWGDGEQVRDWIHVDDVVGAVMAAIEQDIQGPVNLGSGTPTTFNELAAMFCREAGYKTEFKHLPAAPAGVQYRVCDPSKMLSFYKPTVSLREGIRRALR